MVLGSEGRLGLITEATVQVRRRPEERVILGYLFGSFTAGMAAMTEIAASEFSPSVTRISDAPETAFSFATRKASTPLDRVKSKALQTFLTRRKGFDLAEMCLSFIGYEGSAGHVAAERKGVGAIVARHGGVCIGASPGALYDQKKFDTPYIRDFLLDRGAIGDVSETAAPWSALMPLYDTARSRVHAAFAELGVQGYLMCHLSHSYHAGACLYFTFAATPPPGEVESTYVALWDAGQRAVLASGGNLSHHHGVGLNRARFMAEALGAAHGVLAAIKSTLDPNGIMNPGKLGFPAPFGDVAWP